MPQKGHTEAKMGFVAGGRDPWEGKKGWCGEEELQSSSTCPLQAFQPLLTNCCPVLPRKKNTWGKAASFPSFLGRRLSERLGHFFI